MLTIIGCGNSNRSDDGVGPYIAQRLNQQLADQTQRQLQVFDAGTAGIEVMFKARHSERLIIIDASSSGSEPGSLFKVPGEMLFSEQADYSNMHEFRWQHALYSGREIYGDSFPTDITVYLIESESLELGLSLSPSVLKTADELISTLLSEASTSPASRSRSDIQVETALRMAEEADCSDVEKAAMLSEVGTGLQQNADTENDLQNAISLYRAALSRPEINDALSGEIQLLLASTLCKLTTADSEALFEARVLIENALAIITDSELLADGHMQLGLVSQHLAADGRADPRKAIAHYQRALTFFTAEHAPAEHAIIHSNLATLWLSMPGETGKQSIYEAMAVQSFESALRNISADSQPIEYAMLQNNLGNALQYVGSGHPVANNLRALEAYEIAINLREDQPALLANTLANRANCLRNLPDDVEHPERGNQQRLQQAIADSERAKKLFAQGGELDKAAMITELLAELEQQLHEDCAHAS
ncbi:MAG: hydrogenase maturation protease [Spongiibacteraceae bacterium]